MRYFPAALERLTEEFARLPGIGSKSAQRLAFYLLAQPDEEAKAFADAYRKSGETITEWDERLWCLMVEEVRVHRDGTLEFRFRNGTARSEKTR